MHLKMIEDRLPGPQHSRVLLRRNPPQIPWADIPRALADHLRLALQTMSLQQRIIHSDIPALAIFDKERHIWRSIEQLLQQPDFELRDWRSSESGSRSCARIHDCVCF